MGLKADMSEVTEAWSSAPWRVRLFLVICLFLSTSAIASLSDTVFKWKGFVLDAVNFYRQLFAAPLVHYLELLFARSLPSGLVDFALVQLLVVSVIIRIVLHRRRGKTFSNIAISLGLLLYSLVGLASLATYSPLPHIREAWIAYAFQFLMFVLVSTGATRLLVIVYLGLPPLFVGLIAAVHSGITRAG